MHNYKERRGNMSQLINFDKWHVDENHPFGSGVCVKKWLINSDIE